MAYYWIALTSHKGFQRLRLAGSAAHRAEPGPEADTIKGIAAHRLQQHHQRTGTAFGRAHLHKAGPLMLLYQPALHPAFEHRRAAGQSPAPAMHHTHAAQARLWAWRMNWPSAARLVGAQAVQVELALDAPVPGDAGAA